MRAGVLCCIVIILIMFVACPQKQEDDFQYTKVNYDSLFSLGDSAIKEHYIQQAHHQLKQDSLSKEMLSYKGQLSNREKVESEIRQRVIFKDTIITRRHIVRKVDTLRTIIRDTVYVQETVIVPIKKRKRKRK